jgi:hypothetical protein
MLSLKLGTQRENSPPTVTILKNQPNKIPTMNSTGLPLA